MPAVTAGKTLTDSAQISPGIIVNSDINASAGIVYSKLDLALGIVNADVSATAAIVDTKLAAIATAGKVSGAALTSLANIPSGAGVIPAANLPAAAVTQGFSSTTGTHTITHNLNKAPLLITINGHEHSIIGVNYAGSFSGYIATDGAGNITATGACSENDNNGSPLSYQSTTAGNIIVCRAATYTISAITTTQFTLTVSGTTPTAIGFVWRVE